VQDLAADAMTVLAGADDGDRPGGEETPDGEGLGPVLTAGDGHGQISGVGDGEPHAHFATADHRLRLEPGVAEQ
jgi:hypothetical protein